MPGLLEDEIALPPTTGLESNQTLSEERQEIEFLAVSLFLLVLFIAQLLIYAVRRVGVNQSILPESAILLLLGMAIGGLINITKSVDIVNAVSRLTEFDEDIFFLILLPPIIFDAGYTLRRDVFVGNFGVILALAVLGTIVSCITVGVIMFALGKTGLVYRATWLECLVFGALVSATDPVSVIAVFQNIGVKPLLHILVFGESVLNDAVSLVLFSTIVQYEEESVVSVSASTLARAALTFFKILLGSMLLGLAVGAASALLFKRLRLWQVKNRTLECTVALLLPYMSYSFAQGLELSGIVSMLFTGIVMSSYTHYNLSEEGASFLAETYHILAHTAESFVFIYLGMAIFTGDGSWEMEAIAFGFFAVLACLVGRALAVIPLVWVCNLCRPRELRIGRSEVFMLWFSGMRGGMAFALAASSTNALSRSETGQVFETATTIVVFVTVFLFGGFVQCLCERLNLIDLSKPSPLASPYSPDIHHIRHQVIGGDAQHAFAGEFAENLTSSPGGFSEVELSSMGNVTLTNSAGTTPPRGEGSQRAETFAGSAQGKAGSSKDEVGDNGFWNRVERRFVRPALLRSSVSNGSSAGVSGSRSNIMPLDADTTAESESDDLSSIDLHQVGLT